MSGSNEDRPPLRLVEGGRSASRPSRVDEAQESTERLAAILAKAVAASTDDARLADELARSYLARVAETPRAAVDPLDPLTRHTERVGGGPAVPASGVFGNVLDSVPQVEPGTLPSPESSASRPVADAIESPQAGYRPRGGAKRRRRDQRRAGRKEHDKRRLSKLREEIFAKYGQTADIPDIPALRPEVYGMNLGVMRDGTGRKACEVCAKLPLAQQMEIYRIGYAGLAFVRAGTPAQFKRADLASAPGLPKGRDELAAALEVVRAEVAPTLWYRRIVCAAWGMWSHRGKALSEAARKAARGGVYLVEGFCQNALSWLVPRADGGSWSRSVLWGPTGPFTLLGAQARQLGRKVPGESGAGLFVRWQPAAGAARFKGPTRTNAKTGATERFALAQSRYDAPMAGRTASSLARRARGALRELARTVVSVMTPWVELPAKRSRKVPGRASEGEEPSRGVEGAAVARAARAPP